MSKIYLEPYTRSKTPPTPYSFFDFFLFGTRTNQ